MSISSESEPPYNEFYDNKEVSDGESEGFIDRSTKKTAPAKRRAATQPESSFLNGLLAPFEGCCFSRGPPGPPRHLGSARVTGPLSEFVLQTSELSEHAESDESSSEDIALGVTARTYKDRAPEAPEDVVAIRARFEAENVAWKNLVSSSAMDDTARWKVFLPPVNSIDLGLLQLTDDQRKLAALYWCASVTLSQKMTTRLLEKIITVARWELPEQMTVEQALKKRDEFGTLEFQQILEARLIEEIMGEFEQQATAEDPSKTFLVISKVRTVGTVARRQGDALLITVFDLGMSKERGPAFLGFNSVQSAEKYLIDLYTADPMVNKSSTKFSAWTILNKQQVSALKPEDARAKGIALSGEEVKPIWDAEQNDQGGYDDPQRQARIAYTAMYKATDAKVGAR